MARALYNSRVLPAILVHWLRRPAVGLRTHRPQTAPSWRVRRLLYLPLLRGTTGLHHIHSAHPIQLLVPLFLLQSTGDNGMHSRLFVEGDTTPGKEGSHIIPGQHFVGVLMGGCSEGIKQAGASCSITKRKRPAVARSLYHWGLHFQIDILLLLRYGRR